MKVRSNITKDGVIFETSGLYGIFDEYGYASIVFHDGKDYTNIPSYVIFEIESRRMDASEVFKEYDKINVSESKALNNIFKAYEDGKISEKEMMLEVDDTHCIAKLEKVLRFVNNPEDIYLKRAYALDIRIRGLRKVAAEIKIVEYDSIFYKEAWSNIDYMQDEMVELISDFKKHLAVKN